MRQRIHDCALAAYLGRTRRHCQTSENQSGIPEIRPPPVAEGGGDVFLGVNTRATNAGGRNQEALSNTPTLANVGVAVTRFPTSEAQLAHQRTRPARH